MSGGLAREMTPQEIQLRGALSTILGVTAAEATELAVSIVENRKVPALIFDLDSGRVTLATLTWLSILRKNGLAHLAPPDRVGEAIGELERIGAVRMRLLEERRLLAAFLADGGRLAILPAENNRFMCHVAHVPTIERATFGSTAVEALDEAIELVREGRERVYRAAQFVPPAIRDLGPIGPLDLSDEADAGPARRRTQEPIGGG